MDIHDVRCKSKHIKDACNPVHNNPSLLPCKMSNGEKYNLGQEPTRFRSTVQ